MTDHDHVRRLVADHCHLVDDGRIDEWLELFTADAVVHLGGHRWVGHEEIRGWIDGVRGASDRQSRHLVTNVAIDSAADGSATLVSDFILVAPPGEILAVGRYDDVVRSEEGRWRFAERRISMVRP